MTLCHSTQSPKCPTASARVADRNYQKRNWIPISRLIKSTPIFSAQLGHSLALAYHQIPLV